MLEICSEREAVWPYPRRLFCASCAWPKKFSPPAKPKPTWNVPVSFSFTDTSRIILSSVVPRFWLISTLSKKPRAVTRALEARTPVPL